ncbi:hypothetical protein [Massilia endophytica]|uniref:hypothetical protein n=1 Tax=Massilia endophytica TaxID=2899220 RepID=UPI001E40B396|nr:hypothetical protein [Massilia endophytica]UGQ48884.1 hypothetical protein LSQ66_10600 [Massilia endophytica]
MAALDLLRAAADALGLLAASPWRLLLACAVFLLVTEGLMFLPRIGFILKLCVGSLLAAQMLVMFKVAALGEPPQLQTLLDAAYLPYSSMLVLFLAALLPFAAGLGVLWLRRPEALRYFFGNILKTKPPAPGDFAAFKLAMHLVAAPFTFVAAAMVLKGYRGWNAMEEGLVAALLYWQAPLLLFLLSFGFDLAMNLLQKKLPPKAFAALSMPLLLLYVLFLFAFTYTLSVRAFGL